MFILEKLLALSNTPSFSLGAGIGVPDFGVVGNTIFSILTYLYIAFIYIGLPLIVIFILARIIKTLFPKKYDEITPKLEKNYKKLNKEENKNKWQEK